MRRNLRDEFVSPPPPSTQHPRQSKSHFLDIFLLCGGRFGALIGEKVHPDKILTMPMSGSIVEALLRPNLDPEYI